MSWRLSFNSFAKSLRRHGKDSEHRPSCAQRRLRLEPLEARRLLAVYNVNDFSDGALSEQDCENAGPCTLRGAIQLANASPTADVINLPAGLYRLSIVGSDEDATATGDLDILGDLQIVGAGRGQTVIDAGSLNDRAFHLHSGDVSIEGVTISNGSTSGQGGGLLIESEVVSIAINQSTITGNSASQGGGGVFSKSMLAIADSTIHRNSTSNHGGGIFSADEARINLDNSTISGNTANLAGGGIYHASNRRFRIANSTVIGNTASQGGGIYNSQTVEITSSIVSGNTAPSGSELLNKINDEASGEASGEITGDHNLFGHEGLTLEEAVVGYSLETTSLDMTQNGAIPTRLEDIIHPILADNGGAILSHALSGSSPAIDAGANTGPAIYDTRGLGFERTSGFATDIGAFEIQTITVGNATDILNGNINSIATLLNDDGGDGIGLREAIVATNNSPGIDRILFDATFATSNLIVLGGSSLFITDDLVIDGDRNGDGLPDIVINAEGESRVFNVYFGTDNQVGRKAVLLSGLTISGGATTTNGGGIHLNAASLTLSDSTVSGNTATQRGGGIYNINGTLTLENSTISGNTAVVTGGGIENFGGTITLRESTVSGNAANFGGGIYNFSEGTLAIQQSTISGNTVWHEWRWCV